MGLDELLNKAWADHGDDPEGVWERFDALTAEVTEAGQLPRVAGIVAHVGGEHLGRWNATVARVGQLQARADVQEGSTVARSLWRSVAAMRLAGGDPAGAEEAENHARGDGPDASHRARVRAVAASAVAAHGRVDEAGVWLTEALHALTELPSDDAAVRSLAITSNNLATTLGETADRTPDQDALLRLTATEARRLWELAGTWMNVERAEYRLAFTHITLGEPETALAHADACLRICAENQADATEFFFGHEARAYALRAGGDDPSGARNAAAALIDQLGEGIRGYCQTQLAQLDEKLATPTE